MNFRKINVFLDDYISQIASLEEYTPETYKEKMQKIYEIACYIFMEGRIHFKCLDTILPKKNIQRKEATELVSAYLKTVDASFEKGFRSALKEEDIHFLLEEVSQEVIEEQLATSFSATGVLKEKNLLKL